MITLSNGHTFEFQCGSGALGFDGRGWWWEHPLRWAGLLDPTKFIVVAKTVTSEPRKGNLSMWHPWTCVRLLHGGTVNCVGLTNPGIQTWVEKYYPRARKKGYTIAASVESSTWEDAFVLGQYLADLDLAFIEVNASCPNVGRQSPSEVVSKVVKGLRDASSHPIILKLSFGQSQDEDLLKSVNDNGHVEAVHAINAVPWDVIFPDRLSPVERHTGGKGGVSGELIHTLALQAVHNVRHHCPDKQVVAGGGIYSRDSIGRFREAGANAYSFGTLFLKNPWLPNRLIEDYYAK